MCCKYARETVVAASAAWTLLRAVTGDTCKAQAAEEGEHGRARTQRRGTGGLRNLAVPCEDVRGDANGGSRAAANSKERARNEPQVVDEHVGIVECATGAGVARACRGGAAASERCLRKGHSRFRDARLESLRTACAAPDEFFSEARNGHTAMAARVAAADMEDSVNAHTSTVRLIRAASVHRSSFIDNMSREKKHCNCILTYMPRRVRIDRELLSLIKTEGKSAGSSFIPKISFLLLSSWPGALPSATPCVGGV